MMDRRLFLFGGLAALVLPGCGYSLSGRGSFLPASIRTIGVPLFTNRTSLYEIEQRVTEKVRAELTGRGRWTVRPTADGVDAVLTGEITAIWSNPGMQFSEQYEVSTSNSALDPNAFLRQDVNALDRLASEFARAVVSAMLEAF